ncbi:MAG: MarR family transcriptional regulator [Ruminococcus sp.]|nr:MarR family transcriptional regulator [Ruminococcus sp.]
MSEKEVGRLLSEINNLMLREIINNPPYEIEDEGCTFTPISYSASCVMAYLNDHTNTDIFQRDIEREFHVRRSTVSKVLTSLEQKQLIKRVKVEYDRRLKKIVLTDKAKQFTQKLSEHRMVLEDKLTHSISEQELNAFRTTLEKLKRNLSKEENE